MSEIATTIPQAYDGSQIKVLEGLEAVRKRPGMYIGDTGIRGYHHCLWEIVDNSIDEHMGGHCNRIEVTLHKDGSASVKDNGRGIPTDIKLDDKNDPKRSAAEIVMTELHAGGKFENETGQSAYKTSGGLHGVGASVVNALSTLLQLTVCRNGSIQSLEFINGGAVKDRIIEKRDGVDVSPMKVIGKSDERGTEVRFWLDRLIFKEEEGEPLPVFDNETIAASLSTRAHLNPGLHMIFNNEITDLKREWKVEAFVEILDVISANREAPVLPAISASEKVATKNGEVEVMVAFRIHAERPTIISSFANNIITRQGGTHEAGFRTALLKGYNKYAEDNKLTKESFTAEDVREGLVCAVSVRLTEPRFSGQTKESLANTECSGAVNSVTYQALMRFFEENPKIAKAAISRAERASKARQAADKARDMVERKNPLSIGSLPGKLADCQSTDPAECELYIVEGDSAGGSAKQGRDRRTQAILPLKGKPLNVQHIAIEDFAKGMKSEEIANIILVLGCGAGPSFDIAKLKYHKIMILSDADVDGSHIQTLLLTLFNRYTPGLIEGGHVFIAMPPLYRVSKGKGDPTWVRDEKELAAFFASRGGSDGWDVQRFKGLGEMNPEQLWETTMNPETRSAIQLNYSAEGGREADEFVFETLMGKEVPPRRAFIEERAGYARIDR